MAHATPEPHPIRPSATITDRGRLGAPLPASLTPLVGRAADLQTIVRLLAQGARLVTLVGPGGVGKTSLALAVAADSDRAFPDGRCLVALPAIVDPALVVPTIIQALDPRAVVGESPVDQLAETIGERRLLLLLDNMEQVLDAGSSLVRLLAACSNLTVLVTSRVVLRLSGEHVVPVAPLPIPASTAGDAAQIAGYGAVELFAQRARAADPTFALSPENAPVVAEIVRRLDGLPLAIELAADRVRSLSPEAILTLLDDRLRLLTGGPRDRDDRQRTMRNTVAWSYDLLAPQEKALFRRLGVFAGGFPLAAVGPVAGLGGDSGIVVDGITALVDASLLRRLDHPGGQRYAMLETVRAFAREQLEASGELDAVSRAHAEWCISLTEITTYGLWNDDPSGALERLPAEHDNLRAALGWAVEHGETEAAVRLVSSYARFWFMYGHLSEARRWITRALSLPGEASPVYRGRAIIVQAWMSARLGELGEAARLAEAGLAISGAAGDWIGRGRALHALGFIAAESGDYPLAAQRFEELLDLTRAMGDLRWEQAVLTDLAGLAFARGEIVRAAALYESALPIVRALGDREHEFQLTGNLAVVLARQGETRRAAELRRAVLAYAQHAGYPDWIAAALSDAAEPAAQAGFPDVGARLLGASDALRVATGIPEIRAGLDSLARTTTFVREQMDEAAFHAAWDAGAAMPLEAAIAEADHILASIIEEPEREAAPRPASPALLTPRERDVVRLLAAGKSNREIADALYIGHSTAITHVRNLLRKLDLDSRAAVAAWAVRHGLD